MEWVNTMSAENNFITSVDVLFDRRVVYSDGFGNIYVWDVKNNKTTKWKGHNHWIDCVKALYYGKFASGARDGIIKIWDSLKTGDKAVNSRELGYRPDEYGVVNNICRAGMSHIVSTHQHRTKKMFVVNVWNLKTNSVRSKRYPGSIEKSAVQYLNNKIFIGRSGKNRNDIFIWDLGYQGIGRNKNLVAVAAHKINIRSLAVLGDKIVSGSTDKTVKIWTKSSPSWLCEQTQTAQGGVRMIVRAFGNTVIYATHTGKIIIWDVKTADIQTISVDEPIMALGWYFGKIITGSRDGVRIWEYKDISSPVVKLGHKTFPTGTRLFTLITRDTFDKTRDLAFFGKHLGLNVRATLHNTSQSNDLWLHVFNTTEPLRMLTTPKNWRHELFGQDLGFSRLERRLKDYCQENGYDGWHMKVFSDNHGHTFKEAEYETVIIRSSFDKLQFKGKKQITLEDLKDKDHVRVSKKGKITFVKRIERLEEMFENLRF